MQLVFSEDRVPKIKAPDTEVARLLAAPSSSANTPLSLENVVAVASNTVSSVFKSMTINGFPVDFQNNNLNVPTEAFLGSELRPSSLLALRNLVVAGEGPSSGQQQTSLPVTQIPQGQVQLPPPAAQQTAAPAPASPSPQPTPAADAPHNPPPATQAASEKASSAPQSSPPATDQTSSGPAQMTEDQARRVHDYERMSSADKTKIKEQAVEANMEVEEYVQLDNMDRFRARNGEAPIDPPATRPPDTSPQTAQQSSAAPDNTIEVATKEGGTRRIYVGREADYSAQDNYENAGEEAGASLLRPHRPAEERARRLQEYDRKSDADQNKLKAEAAEAGMEVEEYVQLDNMDRYRARNGEAPLDPVPTAITKEVESETAGNLAEEVSEDRLKDEDSKRAEAQEREKQNNEDRGAGSQGGRDKEDKSSENDEGERESSEEDEEGQGSARSGTSGVGARGEPVGGGTRQLGDVVGAAANRRPGETQREQVRRENQEIAERNRRDNKAGQDGNAPKLPGSGEDLRAQTAVRQGDSTLYSKSYIPVLFTRADGEKDVVLYVDNQYSHCVRGGEAGTDRLGDLPTEKNYYLGYRPPAHPWQILIRQKPDSDEQEYKIELNSFLYKSLENFSNKVTLSGLNQWKNLQAEGYLFIEGEVEELECTSATIVGPEETLPQRVEFSGEKQTKFVYPIAYFYQQFNSFLVRQDCFMNLTLMEVCVGGKVAIYPMVI